MEISDESLVVVVVSGPQVNKGRDCEACESIFQSYCQEVLLEKGKRVGEFVSPHQQH